MRSLLLPFCVAIWATLILVPSDPARASGNFSNCAIQDSKLVVSTSSVGTIAVDLLDYSGKVFARQVILANHSDSIDAPLLVPKDGALAQRVKCGLSNDVTYTKLGIIDEGPDVDPLAVYIGHGFLIVSFYAFYRSVNFPERYHGLPNQRYAVQLDGILKKEVALNGTTPQSFQVRIPIVGTGPHKITFSYVTEGAATPINPISFLVVSSQYL